MDEQKPSEDGSKAGRDGPEVDSSPNEPATAVLDEAERLTRLARTATDPAERTAYRERRAAVLAERGYEARVREERDRAVLVVYPDEWLVDGTIRTERIEDIDRATERPLTGTDTAEDWAAVEASNRSIAARVARTHGSVHGANAEAFADFMGNHYARPIETAGPDERAEFLAEYFPRNAWPTAEQKAVVEESIDRVLELANDDRDGPPDEN